MKPKLAARFSIVATVVAVVAIVQLANVFDAFARGPRISPAQIKAAQKAIADQQEMEQNLYLAQQKRDQQTIAQFDLNSNGKIDVNEKPQWDKFWREVKLGKRPHPYDSITEDEIKPGANKKTAANSKDAAKKDTAKKN